MWYLLRYCERGLDAKRRRTRDDIVGVLRSRLPNHPIETDVGRVFVDGGEHAAARVTGILDELHGIASYSPCWRCELGQLDRCVREFAQGALHGHVRSFAVSVRRVGSKRFGSRSKAAQLGALILADHPRLTVDLAKPDVRIEVEIRGTTCFVFDRRTPGADRRAGPQVTADRFMVDRMLGNLVRWLRLAGFDTEYAPDWADCGIARICRRDRRLLLTQDFEFASTPAVSAYFVRSRVPEEQLAEVITALSLPVSREQLLTRCTLCNSPIGPIDAAHVHGRVPEPVLAQYERFFACHACDKIYWEGAHCERILARLGSVLPVPA